MIMQTDAENCSSRDRPDGNVTQPFVSETYRCMATYETKDTRNKPFKVVVDDKLDVLIKDRTGELTTAADEREGSHGVLTRLSCWFRVVACRE